MYPSGGCQADPARFMQRFPIGLTQLEGMNNRIKVIKRMTYGYRDTVCIFMKIRASFSGKER